MGRRIDYVKNGLLKGYKFDGCTSSPDFDFVKCCNRHDYDYQNMSMSRLKADARLFKCMARASFTGKLLAPVYWTVVRVFGGNHFKRKQDETRQIIATDLTGGPN